MSGPEEPVTVFLPTWNGGARLDAVLASVRSQRTGREIRLRAIDSGSTDGTPEVLDRHGVQWSAIEQTEFDHGATRRRGVMESDTSVVVLLTQDACPQNDGWLEALLAAFQDPTVAGAWSRQVVRPHCHPFQRINVEAHMRAAEAQGILEGLTSDAWGALPPEQRAARLVFDDVSSAVRRRVVESVPIPDTPFGEDVAWARAVLVAGHRLAFASDSVVEHSHDVNRSEFYDRVRISHATLKRLTDHRALETRSAALRAFRWTARTFLRTARRDPDLSLPKRLAVAAQALPYAALQVAATWRGGREGTYEPPGSVGRGS